MTDRPPAPAICTGSGKLPAEGSMRKVATGRDGHVGRCQVCGHEHILTTQGERRLRTHRTEPKHRTKKEQP